MECLRPCSSYQRKFLRNKIFVERANLSFLFYLSSPTKILFAMKLKLGVKHWRKMMLSSCKLTIVTTWQLVFFSWLWWEEKKYFWWQETPLHLDIGSGISTGVFIFTLVAEEKFCYRWNDQFKKTPCSLNNIGFSRLLPTTLCVALSIHQHLWITNPL